MLPSVCAGAQVPADLTTLAVALAPPDNHTAVDCCWAVGGGGQQQWWSRRRALDWQWYRRQRHSSADWQWYSRRGRQPRRRAAQTPTRGSAVGGAVVGTVITAPPASAPLLTMQPPHTVASAPAACITALLSAAIAVDCRRLKTSLRVSVV